MSNWKIIREANDPLALRLSIGAPHDVDDGYIVYRGDTSNCVALLETALEELKQHLQEQGE